MELLFSAAVSATVYMTTKTISYLSSVPAPGDNLQTIKSSLARVNREAKSYFGHYWEVWTNMYWDNLWISAFALSLLLTASPQAITGILI